MLKKTSMPGIIAFGTIFAVSVALGITGARVHRPLPVSVFFASLAGKSGDAAQAFARSVSSDPFIRSSGYYALADTGLYTPDLLFRLFEREQEGFLRTLLIDLAITGGWNRDVAAVLYGIYDRNPLFREHISEMVHRHHPDHAFGIPRGTDRSTIVRDSGMRY
jgi:hypothetical protein